MESCATISRGERGPTKIIQADEQTVGFDTSRVVRPVVQRIAEGFHELTRKSLSNPLHQEALGSRLFLRAVAWCAKACAS